MNFPILIKQNNVQFPSPMEANLHDVQRTRFPALPSAQQIAATPDQWA